VASAIIMEFRTIKIVKRINTCTWQFQFHKRLFFRENSRNLSFTHVIDMAFLLAVQLPIIKKYFIEIIS